MTSQPPEACSTTDWPRLASATLLGLGILLIVMSWTSVGRWAFKSTWSTEDSAVYDKLVVENHRIGFEDPARLGITPDELAVQQKRIDEELAVLSAKLEHVRSRPKVWSRALFWAGAVVATLGALIHFTQPEQSTRSPYQSNPSPLSHSQSANQPRNSQ